MCNKATYHHKPLEDENAQMRLLSDNRFGGSYGGYSWPACLRHLLIFMFLHHLDLLIDKMNQKSAVVQNVISVPKALTLDTRNIF